MKVHHKEIILSPFYTPIVVVVGETITSAINHANKIGRHKTKILHEESDSLQDGIYFKNIEEFHFIFLKYDSSFNTVIHECFHAVMLISSDKGARYSVEGDELFAYMMGNFSEDVTDFFYSLAPVKKLFKSSSKKRKNKKA